MKWSKIIKSLLTLILVFLFSTNLSTASGDKHALIIAIGNYNFKETKWAPISSLNDIPIIKDALIKQGFPEDNIIIIKDNEATKDGIVRNLSLLKERVNKGDVVLVHYSGHGQQIQDDNGDEVDGYDEALIPIDAHNRFQKGVYEGENHLRDEELGNLLNQIRIKITQTGNLLVVLDACHSGTGTRGLTKVRGTEVPFKQDGYNGSSQQDNDAFGVLTEQEDAAPMVSFFGASPHELNYEYEAKPGTYVGSLSYAFAKAFSEANNNTTYRGIFDKIKLEMSSIAPKQTPQSEGTLDQEILGGNIVGQINYFRVSHYYDNKNMTLDAGQLSGIHEGTKVGFYDMNVTDPSESEPKATGKIIFADLTTADVELDETLEEKTAKSSWVFITEKSFGKLNVSVKLSLKNNELRNALKNKINKTDLIAIVDDNPDLIIEEDNEYTRGNSVQIYSKFDYVLWSQPAAKDNTEQTANDILKNIESYSQTKFLRNIEVEDEKLNTTFSFIPVKTKQAGRRTLVDEVMPIEEKQDNLGNLIFEEGDYFKVKVTNNGYKGAYFTLIDIQPNDKINVLIPYGNNSSADYYLEPGGSWESPLFVFGKPYGNEVFKLITTEEPMDLRPVIQTRGESARGSKEKSNPFQILMSDTYKVEEMSQRGGSTANIPQGSANVYSKTFKIVKKETK